MKTILVGEVCHLHENAFAEVEENVSLEEVITIFAHNPSVRAVFVVDAEKRYAGMFSHIDLLRWAHIQLFGGKGRREIPIREVYRLADAKTARDLESIDMSRLSVRETDTLQTALDLMLEYEIDIIPVTDDNRKIISDIKLSEILLKALEEGRHAGA